MSFYRLQKEHIPFVIRIKDATSATRILTYYKTPDALLQPGSEKNEDSALLELARRSSFQKAIFIADRGYEALMSFYRLQKEHIPFVIRIKDATSATRILTYYKTPDSEEYDIPFNVILTCKNNRHVKDHWDVYKYISSYRKQPEFDGQTTELPLNIRVVTF